MNTTWWSTSYEYSIYLIRQYNWESPSSLSNSHDSPIIEWLIVFPSEQQYYQVERVHIPYYYWTLSLKIECFKYDSNYSSDLSWVSSEIDSYRSTFYSIAIGHNCDYLDWTVS